MATTAEIKRPWSNLGVIFGIGGWRGPCYRRYIQLREDEEEDCIVEFMEFIDLRDDSPEGELIEDPSQGPNIHASP